MRLMGVRITAGGGGWEGERKAPIPLTTQFQFPHARINSTQPADAERGAGLLASVADDQGKEDGRPTSRRFGLVTSSVRQTKAR